MAKARNGKIEWMRFVFSILIVLFHINLEIWGGKQTFGDYFSLSGRGRIGVEFFFVVSGYLMAATAFRNQKKAGSLGKETVQFMTKKLYGIWPWHLVAFTLLFIAVCVCEQRGIKEIAVLFFRTLPNLFLVQKVGIPSYSIMTVEWYLCSMLVGMFILYPLCRRYYDTMTRIVSPLAGLILTGFLTQVYGCLSNTKQWIGIVPKTQVRAIAGLCFGMMAFEIARYVAQMTLTKKQRLLATVVENGCYIAVILFASSQMSLKYESFALLALTVAVTLTFSNAPYGIEKMQNWFIYFLGRYSLPIYLSQDFAQKISRTYLQSEPRIVQVVFIFVTALVTALVVMAVGKWVQKRMQNGIFQKILSM